MLLDHLRDQIVVGRRSGRPKTRLPDGATLEQGRGWEGGTGAGRVSGAEEGRDGRLASTKKNDTGSGAQKIGQDNFMERECLAECRQKCRSLRRNAIHFANSLFFAAHFANSLFFHFPLHFAPHFLFSSPCSLS